jgi:hypothetical protein
MLRTCIFCQQPLTNRAKEHIIPDWLQEHLDAKGLNIEISLLTPSGTPQDKRQLVLGAHKYGKVCYQCNHDWMGPWECETAPILKPLIDDIFSGNLSFSDCQKIARWVFKTVLVLESASLRTGIIPWLHFARFYTHQAIPAFTSVAIARLTSERKDINWLLNQNWRLASQHPISEILTDDLRKTYKVTLGIGHLAARVHYFPLTTKPLYEYESGIRYICRPPATGISWPPTDSLTDVFEFDQSLIITD